MTDFKQSYVSEVLEPVFGPDFRNKWKLTDYNETDNHQIPKEFRPCVFLGLYTQNDIRVWNQHKSYKILYFGGSDIDDFKLKIVKSTPLVMCIGYGGDWLYSIFNKYGLRYSTTKISLKNFGKEFRPFPLGDKIYVYKGISGDRENYFNWNKTIKPLIEIFGVDKFIFTSNKNLNELIEDYYKKCFIYIKPNPKGGSRTMIELGLMGRKTITNEHSSFPNTIPFNSIEDIVSIIESESKKIGTTVDLSEEINSVFLQDNKWLNIDFYNSDNCVNYEGFHDRF